MLNSREASSELHCLICTVLGTAAVERRGLYRRLNKLTSAFQMYPNRKDIFAERSATRNCTFNMSPRLTVTLWQHLKPDDSFMLARMRLQRQRLPRATSTVKHCVSFELYRPLGFF